MRDMLMILDLQFGSTGKGQIAGTLGRKWEPDTVACANGPNAGHTYRWTINAIEDPSVGGVVHTVLPVTAILPTVRNILLGPGAVINLDKLNDEIRGSFSAFRGKNLIIHSNAVIVSELHREREKEFVRIGSTMKGTAEAVIDKMRRGPEAPIADNQQRHIKQTIEQSLQLAEMELMVSADKYDRAMDSSRKLVVEGAQGHSLSIQGRFYPHCTSRDVGSHQLMSDCRVPLPERGGRAEIIGVCRTYPIRVANRRDADGKLIGFSGGHYDDQMELQWDAIKREPELTTVTRLPRRLFTFSTKQVIEAARYNAMTGIALTFCDYLNAMEDKVGDLVSHDVRALMRRIWLATNVPVRWLSYGPTDQDLYSTSTDRMEDTLKLTAPERLFKGM